MTRRHEAATPMASSWSARRTGRAGRSGALARGVGPARGGMRGSGPTRTASRGAFVLLALALVAARADAAPETSPRPLVRPIIAAEAPEPQATTPPRATLGLQAAPGPIDRPADPSGPPGPPSAAGSSFALGPSTALGPPDASGSLFPLDLRAPPGAEEALGPRSAAGLFVVLGPPDPASPVVAVSLRPEARPDDIVERARAARAAVLSPARIASPDASVRRATGASGAVCGSPSIVGQPLATIPGRLRGCGVAKPVRVTAVAGVRLSTPAVLDCRTARALAAWVEGGVRPAVGARGGGLEGLHVVAHYACRTRNNRPGAKISEHGRGRAIDIAALLLADGSRITVLRGWHRRGAGAILRAVHASACGPFGTVLGPDGDRFHQDHLHLDTTPRRRAYCR